MDMLSSVKFLLNFAPGISFDEKIMRNMSVTATCICGYPELFTLTHI
jgi:hypothetical protein